MVKVKVVVGKNEIKNGRPNECDYWPIALALIKSFPEVDRVSVGTHLEIMANDNDCTTIIEPTNQALLKFMDTFDEGKQVKPFSFFIKLSNKLSKIMKPSKKYIVKEVALGKS